MESGNFVGSTLTRLIFADFTQFSQKSSNSAKFHVWIKKSNNTIKLFFIIHLF